MTNGTFKYPLYPLRLGILALVRIHLAMRERRKKNQSTLDFKACCCTRRSNKKKVVSVEVIVEPKVKVVDAHNAVLYVVLMEETPDK